MTFQPVCPLPFRMKCSWCQFDADGNCDRCYQRFNSSCFEIHAEQCPAVQHLKIALVRLIPECRFCNRDAKGRCCWCNEYVCRICFDQSHKVKYKYIG